ncbi:amino acid permease [Komagataeibacter sp. FXV3]|uniref:amino acid permease n=1 Tax=Komagataeibacter sp. FXV3 TaxID=2608998 RepID=UPI001D0FBA2D|nr:amino acid permease [Komagataeibacter sp. FXV3]
MNSLSPPSPKVKTAPENAVLKDRHVSMISIGGVIGASLFVGSATAISTAGAGVLFSYFLCGLLVMCVTRMLGEMTVASPDTGSFVGQIRRGLGLRVGFIAGWIYWIMWATLLGLEAIAAASFLSPYLPLPYLVIELLVIGIMTGVNLFSVRGYGEFEYWFSVLKITTIVVFILIGVSVLFGVKGAASPGGALFSAAGLIPHGLFTLLAVIPGIMLSMAGSEITTIAACDSHDPAGNVARSTRTVVLRIMIFYLVSIGLIIFLLPLSRVVPGYSPFLATLEYIGVPFASAMMTAVMLIATLSALNSGIYITSRILCELAENGDAPRTFLQRNAKGTPVRAILCGCVVAVIVALVGMMAPGRVFGFLVSASGTFILFDYVLIVVAHIRLRRACMARGEPPALPMWGFPFLSYGILGALLATLVTMFFATEHTRQEIVLSTISLGIIIVIENFSFGRRRRNGYAQAAQAGHKATVPVGASDTSRLS